MSKVANYNISLKCFLKNKNWEVLILKSPENSSFKWLYDFPWWRIDEDEFEVDYVEILKREIFEESWILKVEVKDKTVAIWRHKAIKVWKEDESIFYVFFEWFIEDENQKVIISHEHVGFEWIKLEEIKLEDYFISWYLEWVKMYLGKN